MSSRANNLPPEYRRFPASWQILPFSEAIKDKTGGNVKIKKSEMLPKGLLAVIDQGHSEVAGYVDDVDSQCQECLPCILFGDHTKLFKFVEKPFALGADGVKVLAPTTGFDKKFVFYYLDQIRLPEKTGYSRHFKYLKETFVPKPPLSEQKRIVHLLDKAHSISEMRQRILRLADQYLQAIFLDIFGDPVTNPKGWKEAVLKDISEIRSGVTKGKKVDLKNSLAVPYMRVANVQDGYLDLSDVQKITVSLKDAEKYQLKQGDVLLTEGGDPDKLGRGYVWRGELKKCIHQNHVFAVRVDERAKVHPIFLSALIGSQRGKRYFLKVGKQTTGIATINKTVLSEFVLIVPPYQKQMQYVAAVEKIMAIKSSHTSSELGLFESIRQSALSGQI